MRKEGMRDGRGRGRGRNHEQSPDPISRSIAIDGWTAADEIKVLYRARNKDMQILLSNSQAMPGTTVKQEQE